jgi:hypothetical protein
MHAYVSTVCAVENSEHFCLVSERYDGLPRRFLEEEEKKREEKRCALSSLIFAEACSPFSLNFDEI